jgi:N-acyl-L-homoserine lactone synthetase
MEANMQVTTLSFDNMHNHGQLFANMLRARHSTFIEEKNWDLPQVEGMEFDQYDTPASRWIAVHDFGCVLAGVRLTPTTARCGIYSYMVRDAQRGLLETIPDTILFEQAPIASHIWDASRIFVARDVSAAVRQKVQMHLISEMVKSARDVGATMLLGLLPVPAARLARRVGLDCQPAGPEMDIGGVEHQCYIVSMATKMH